MLTATQVNGPMGGWIDDMISVVRPGAAVPPPPKVFNPPPSSVPDVGTGTDEDANQAALTAGGGGKSNFWYWVAGGVAVAALGAWYVTKNK